MEINGYVIQRNSGKLRSILVETLFVRLPWSDETKNAHADQIKNLRIAVLIILPMLLNLIKIFLISFLGTVFVQIILVFLK